jgi:hypothetical protein
MMVWRPEDLGVSLVRDLTSHPVVTISITTPVGELIFMGEPEEDSGTLICRDVHVQGPGANSLGVSALIALAQSVMRELGYHGLVIMGAVRTTGASPGTRPRDIRFTRRDRL